MNKMFLLSFIFSIATSAKAWEAPEILTNACYEGCTPKMEEVYSNFLNTPTAPQFYPGMYSGECNHLSGSLDPETTHYIGMLMDNHPQGPYMAPVLQYFGEENSMGQWSLEEARSEMSPDWIKAGRMTFHPTSVTAHVEDAEGYPVMVYWARQNLATKEIYFLSLFRGASSAFCTLRPNVNGLPQ